MRDEGSLDSSSLKAFQKKSQVGCFVLSNVFTPTCKALEFKHASQ